MEKRLVLAIVLSFLVLMGYQYFFVKPEKARLKPPVAADAVSAPAAVPGTSAPAAPQPAPAPSRQEAPAALPPQDLAAVAGQAEKDVVVDTPLYRAVWSNKGAVLKSWTLKTHKNNQRQDLEMVPALAGELGRFPFSVGLDDAALAGRLNASLFEASGTGLELAAGARGEIRFVYSDGATVRAEKTFGFTGGSYVVATDIKVWKDGQPVTASVLWGPGIGNMTLDEAKQSYSALRGSAVYTGGKVLRMNERKFKSGQNAYNFVDWAAYEENYFAALFVLPRQRGQAAFQQEPGQAAAGPVTVHFLYVTQPSQAFIGPKDSLALKAFGHDATKVINYGTFGFIAEIMLVVTRYFHTLVPNWGVAIILLTILLKILFFPLTYSSTKSMMKMADVQPKIKALQAKYKKAKTDIAQRQAMNEEMMKLYKEHGINPAGGCLPLLIQLPVFWGVFRMLVAAVEFRHAPFALWITDLSIKDPYYVTPVLMGITQFISQKMTPSTASPSQTKMMLAMPFVMTIFFLNFQSGLVLYWLTTNVLQIGQQALMNDLMKKAKTAKAR
ncbi:MAG TPA: membrane protein insertase YidC [Candidatus Aminicenantes bacterium]|nr:membrane protein insertase YidC [Candidatus Aminicenantes bacterium]HRY64205.1 membrane protein insertase YidC [Candidatus Aminicenantes bacterium]HRZ71118.1 membrane protein insertase YidC [Candidatus Aminicenantes bacterium]